MKKNLFLALTFISLLLTGCSNSTITQTPTPSGTADSELTQNNPTPTPTTNDQTPVPSPVTPIYENISQDEAKAIMDSGVKHIILDVRTRSEYDEGHIPGAILIPHTEIHEKAENIIKDKNVLILVYCRSGNRSKTASEYLLELGYTNIKEFGGINTWQYEIE